MRGILWWREHGRGPVRHPRRGGSGSSVSGPASSSSTSSRAPDRRRTSRASIRSPSGSARTSAASGRRSTTSRSRPSGRRRFQAAIADALRGVPWGEVVTYGELAALAGRPRAPRAAGTFCAENRFPLVVPCHRVVSLVRARRLRLARRRLQAPAARARGRRAVRLSEDVRAELAAIEPRKPCCRLAELSALVRGAGTRPPARRWAHRRAPGGGERRGGAARLLAPALVRRRVRDPHLQAARLRARDAVPDPPGGRRPRAPGAERGGDSRLQPRPADAAAAPGRRRGRAAGRPTCAAPFSPPAR